MSYNQYLSKIAALVGKPAATLKQIGRAPKGLSRFEYITEILPHIGNFMITDKADGIRGIIEIAADGRAHAIVGADYFEFDVTGPACTIDCEVLADKKQILMFDVLAANGQNMTRRPFKDRYACLSKIELRSPDWQINTKQFYVLSTATYQKQIMELYNAMKKFKYKTDGIIMTEAGHGYTETLHYKWKSPEHLTIDFLLIDGELYSGISRRVFKQIGLSFPQNYASKTAPWNKFQNGTLQNEFFPIPFMPSVRPMIYKAPIHGIKNAEQANGRIVELSWQASTGTWKYHRTRDDRANELKEGNYYGNNFKIAELTLESALNPLSIKDLVRPLNQLTDAFYFEKSDARYKSVRNFNSYVKSTLIKRYAGTPIAIDMASGKGQDLGRYYDAKIGQLLMLEIDQSAIDELIKRKYDMSKDIWIDGIDRPMHVATYKPTSTSLYVAQMDLNDSTPTNIQTIADRFIENTSAQSNKPSPIFSKQGVSLIVCNMALHYMLGTPAKLLNIVKFIDHWLAPNGYFLMTTMSAQKIKELLGDKKKWSDESGIYQIERAEPGHINVLLPCSSGLRKEALVDLNALDKAFNKFGITRVDTKTFDNFFANYSKMEMLSATDKQFVSLYQYAIFVRCANVSAQAPPSFAERLVPRKNYV